MLSLMRQRVDLMFAINCLEFIKSRFACVDMLLNVLNISFALVQIAIDNTINDGCAHLRTSCDIFFYTNKLKFTKLLQIGLRHGLNMTLVNLLIGIFRNGRYKFSVK